MVGVNGSGGGNFVFVCFDRGNGYGRVIFLSIACFLVEDDDILTEIYQSRKN